ncbi:nucleotidyltransferase family protein [Emticicia sp. TH156]|uniref:nucleotidyltransferase family protein n=1 Tax=Emticicia sp. TH156 TaxID=2067454 RepID=UPI000C76E4C2|nr:nucleotidyltransferase family protein [Emticicia sp. TH156]PLK43844.1 hypothetical protein C0V77_15190 [Emticicia sp. TH156]
MDKRTKQFTLELLILVEAIKLMLLKENSTNFENLINDPKVNWSRLYRLAAYHSIRPFLYEACRRVGIQNEYVDNLKRFTHQQVINHLASRKELGRILHFFSKNNVQAIPYKGILFSEKIYKNQIVRESVDVDIIVKPEHAMKGVKLLLADGYILSLGHYNQKDSVEINDELINELLTRNENQEIGFDKFFGPAVRVHIDYHWSIGEKFHDYVLEVDDMLGKSVVENFQNQQLLVPNSEIIFKMIMNHHGGRGCWVRLKDFCDLIAYRNSFPENDDKILSSWSAEMKTRKVFEVGNAIMNNLFFEPGNFNSFEKQIQQRIFDFWEAGKHYDRVWPKFKYNIIYKNLQDKPLSWIGLINKLVQFYSVTSKLERPRLIVFPDRFVYLNAFTKFVSYLWFRAKLKKN